MANLKMTVERERKRDVDLFQIGISPPKTALGQWCTFYCTLCPDP